MSVAVDACGPEREREREREPRVLSARGVGAGAGAPRGGSCLRGSSRRKRGAGPSRR